MRFAFGAGGTGGHIVPAIALAKEMKAKGHHCIFIGNKNSLEERLSQKEGFPFFPIKVQKLYRSLTPTNLTFPYYLIASILKSISILKQQRIDGVITTGGFVAGPVAIAALFTKKPSFLHESNSFPGLTTRKLASHLKRLYISYGDTKRFIKKADMKNLGTPIIVKDDTQALDLEDIGLINGRKTLLVTGGSQGSLAINTAVSKALRGLIDSGWQIIWQTGKNSYQQFKEEFEGTPSLYLFDFTNQMTEMMLASDLAISRAGAITLAELRQNKLPAILIPLPTAADNHQYFNAKACKDDGIAEILEQKDLSKDTLFKLIQSVDYLAMKETLATMKANTAAKDVVEDILNFY